jgi:hypothetical protein
MRIRRFASAVFTAALCVLGAGAAVASSASAATTVTASTSVTNHPDTTAASGPACGTSANGPVWANDFYISGITATAEANPVNTWDVKISDSGKFVGSADPNTCQSLQSLGNLAGTYELTVTSPSAPVAADLKSNYDGAVSTTTMVSDFFGGKATSIVGGAYDFSYQNGNYVQDTAGQHGAVVASRFSAPFVMKNSLSGKCMNVKDGVYAEGGSVNQYTCGATWHGLYAGAQRFVRENSGDGGAYLVAVSPDGSHPMFFVHATTERTPLSLTNWPEPYSYRTGGFFSWHGLDADDQGFSKSNLTNIVGYPYTGASNQQFTAVNV